MYAKAHAIQGMEEHPVRDTVYLSRGTRSSRQHTSVETPAYSQLGVYVRGLTLKVRDSEVRTRIFRKSVKSCLETIKSTLHTDLRFIHSGWPMFTHGT